MNPDPEDKKEDFLALEFLVSLALILIAVVVVTSAAIFLCNWTPRR